MGKFIWKKGDRSALAAKAGIRLSNLSLILSGKRGVSVNMALKLEKASIAIGKKVKFEHWIFNDSTQHPAFFNKKRSKRRKTGA